MNIVVGTYNHALIGFNFTSKDKEKEVIFNMFDCFLLLESELRCSVIGQLSVVRAS